MQKGLGPEWKPDRAKFVLVNTDANRHLTACADPGYHAAAGGAAAATKARRDRGRHYGPDWYAAYLRDPTGNKLAIVYRKPAAS